MKQVAGVMVASLILSGLSGCAGMARQEDDQLVLSGFTKSVADTPREEAALESLPPHRFVHQTVNGVPTVFYADPVGCKCVYSATAQVCADYKQTHREVVAVFDWSLSAGDSGNGHRARPRPDVAGGQA